MTRIQISFSKCILAYTQILKKLIMPVSEPEQDFKYNHVLAMILGLLFN